MKTAKLRKKTRSGINEGYSTIKLQNFLSRNNSSRTVDINLKSVSFFKSATKFKDIAQAWLENARLYLKKSSYSTYNTIILTHLLPNFGDMAIAEINTQQISVFLTDLSNQGILTANNGLASSTVRSIASVLRSILKYAEAKGYDVKTQGCVIKRKDYGHETRILSDREWKLLEYCLMTDIDATKLGILISMYTGIRLGEICALKWGDISIDNGTLTIKRTMQRINNPAQNGNKTIVIIDAPKSQSANRSIPLPSNLLTIMKQFEAASNCFVLTGEPMAYIEPRSLQYRFKSILYQAGIEDINFHAIRHTFATKCVGLGFDIKTLSKILGHSDVSVTLNTNVHPSLNVMRSYMERLNESE